MVHVRDLDEIGRTSQAYLKDGKNPVDLAVSFLHAYAKKFVTSAIDKYLKSYSVNIATKGETISPLNLLKVLIMVLIRRNILIKKNMPME